MSSNLFALDIGTRSVVGIILQENEGKYLVKDLVSIEHTERSMIDGQIHNIKNVANVILEVKRQLEEKHGQLKRVIVAAAGRALITEEGVQSIDLSKESIISTEDVNRLELAAVQNAQQSLLEKQEHNDRYYCVGYSVLHYTLDNQTIGSLIEQTGKDASIHVIATFLPQVVIESLLAALKHAQLEMEALTLEPIAAIHVLVPPSMRRLNIALVDVGAGTSDIAIANGGTITAYGMVPLAGDEVTDALSHEFLLDFPVAEKVKRQLSSQTTVEIEDILGFTQEVPTSEISIQLQPTVQRIASSIANEIQRLNSDVAPKAVILVGGGSMTPQLSNELSKSLGLPENRVGVRGLEALTGVTVSDDLGQSPELVTPIGIAIAARKAPLHYMTVTVNDHPVRLFDLKDVTIADALIASNYSIEELYGKPGQGMTITYNGSLLAIPGEHGQPSKIFLNNEQASLKETIQHGDIISVSAGEKGLDASPTVSDLLDGISPIQVTIENRLISLEPEIFINGIQKDLNASIQDRDKITISHDTSLQKALEKAGFQSTDAFSVTVNHKPMYLKNRQESYYLSGLPINVTYKLSHQDIVTIETPPFPNIEELAMELGISIMEKIKVVFNSQEVSIEKARYNVTINNKSVAESAYVEKGDKIEFISLPYSPIIFSDVFTFIDYQLPNNVQGPYQLLRNGKPIQFNDQIFQGDNLEILFQENHSV